ncbi:hypothetical protein K2X33_04555 [bacterium]|nr:hypothetical protein [bacterium]
MVTPRGKSIFGALIALMTAVGCSSLLSSEVELTSDPVGAHVRTFLGKDLGATPLTLSGDALGEVVQSGKLQVIVSHPGFQERELILDVHAKDAHQVKLKAHDSAFFEQLMQTYPTQANELIRDILKIQGLLIVKQFDAADAAIQEFQKKYPTVAATYVMQGEIQKSKGNMEMARSFFLRARSLDPKDPVVQRNLELTK